MSKTLNQGTGRACACQGKTLGEVFAQEEYTDAAERLRRSDAMRHEQEMSALTVRLEVAEDEVERLTKELDQQKSWTAANVDKVKAENDRLFKSIHEEQRQRRVIAEMLDVPPDAGLDETLTAIRRLQALVDQPSLDIVAREKPEDLPAAYLFAAVRYWMRESPGVDCGSCDALRVARERDE